ncbi:YidC/Oxa1 family membrane protein insertase [Aliarcobacter cryaerophilus]|uniref:YidC/Oxa1 family membrane protein insertase n=1 Tax=Aliarcobacter cryaerophilus TaxID=28198 RepID=UPI0021B396AA|nr:YidC/Oxa1 family membrane protein insertase [Aliarcobacter cryaerophilus]MCT7523249.1 YidC/Oxa1 family membrane protein insertase [Aliarcobacter cryaerophilus]
MELLYTIFLLPIETIMKLVLELAYNFTNNYGVAIILLSIIINIALIPIYNMAEKWREKDKAIRDSMKFTLDKIKQNYKGKERYFYTQALYKIHNYSPISSVKASAGFLIQIPFFFAAFSLLSDYEPIAGVGFWILSDLSQADGLLFGLNLLPFIMTAVNLLAAYVYINKFDKNEKYQLWGIAILFLVLLYTQASALLLYWTFNNIFSLFKNLIEKYIKINFNFKFKKTTKDKILNENIENKFGFKTIFSIKFLFDSLVSLVLLLIISIIASKLLPSGINLVFNERSIKFYIILSAFVFLILFIIVKFRNTETISFSKKLEKITKIDLLLLLIPIAIVFQYVILNTEMLSEEDIVLFVLKSLFISIVFILVIPYFLSIISDKKLISSVTTAYLFVLFFMPTLALMQNWHKIGSFKIQFPILFILIALIYILYSNNKKLLSIFISVFFIFTITNAFLNKENLAENQNKYYLDNNHKNILDVISKNPIKNKNDVIFLIYESYVNEETMNYYGFDNSNQVSFLKEKGFKIYDKNYSIGPGSLASMSRAMNISREVSGQNIREYTAGNNFVVDILSKDGYKKIGIVHSDSYFSGTNPSWDLIFPKRKSFDLLKAVKEGEFRFDFNTEKISYDDYLMKKIKILGTKKNSPYFMYTHNRFPGHTQNSGKCLPHEKQNYFDNVKKANIEMKNDLETLLKVNPNAVVIVAGDHGPYHTINCTVVPKKYDINKINRYDIQDRYGSFLAIKWPKNFKDDYNISTLQDVFPAVLANLYESENIWKTGRTSSKTTHNSAGVGIYVEDGIIHGGENDGEPLFLGVKK